MGSVGKRKVRTATRNLAVLFAAIFGVADCAQLQPPSASNQSSNATSSIRNFGDVLNGDHSQRSQLPNAPKSPIVGDLAGSPSKENTQSTIYDGEGVGPHEALVVPPEPAAAPSGGIMKAVYPVADNAVVPIEGGNFLVTFENADIGAVARAILGDSLKANYAIDPRVHGTISLSTQRPVSASQLLLLLESALQFQGFIIVHQSGVYRILPANQAPGVGSANIGPDSGTQGFGITALPLQNISAEALNKILNGFGATQDTVHVDAAHNLLIVRGSTEERQWLIDTALAFDVNWMRNQSVGIFPVRNTAPEIIINEIHQMADSDLVRLQPIGRLNAVLAVAKSPDAIHQVQTWIARLDRQNDYGPRAHIYRLKIADARKVVSVLRETFGTGGGAGSTEETPGPTATAISAPTQGATSLTQGQAASSTTNRSEPNPPATRGGLGAADEGSAPGKVRITADVASNAVVVYATQEQYRSIEPAIVGLDRPTPEVAIEAIAAEVTLNDNLSYGVQFFLNGAFKNASGNITPLSGSQLTAPLPLGQMIPGANFVVGALANPSVVISALRDVTDVKILSSPSLVVADNQAAVLQVGDQVPVTTGTATSVITTQSAIVNSVSYVDTGVILRVTPHVSRTAQVRLDIEQEVSSVAQNANASTLTPTITRQRIKSTVEIDNGQTVLLAGLISEQRNMEKSGIPGVVDVPILGNILSNSTHTAKRTELIVFVKPQIIHNKIDAERVARGLRERMPSFDTW
jgi:general secretion pathway protein D